MGNGTESPDRGWLVLEYRPVGLFSLKSSMATSAVGKTLLVPTPYAIKMAIVDAAFRLGSDQTTCERLLRSLVGVEVRICPPSRAIVTHTFLKVRQEPKEPRPLRPYISSIAYREVVFYDGDWRWAFRCGPSEDVFDLITECAPRITYIGKRGSFIQFVGHRFIAGEIGPEFTLPMDRSCGATLPPRSHLALLDDLGPEADLQTLSSFSPKKARRDKHRRYVWTLVPLGLTNSGASFSEYQGRDG